MYPKPKFRDNMTFLLLLLLASLPACATGMEIARGALRDLEPGEGRILGSFLVQGGGDILGRTRWRVVAKKVTGAPYGIYADFGFGLYSVEARRDGGEVIFLTTMPAGKYTFFKLVQPGSSSAHALFNVTFNVKAGQTVYLGRLDVHFPPGLIHVRTKIDIRVSDAKAATVDRAESQYGISLPELVTDHMLVEKLRQW